MIWGLGDNCQGTEKGQLIEKPQCGKDLPGS